MPARFSAAEVEAKDLANARRQHMAASSHQQSPKRAISIPLQLTPPRRKTQEKSVKADPVAPVLRNLARTQTIPTTKQSAPAIPPNAISTAYNESPMKKSCLVAPNPNAR
jgi:hypothetical protein